MDINKMHLVLHQKRLKSCFLFSICQNLAHCIAKYHENIKVIKQLLLVLLTFEHCLI